MPETSGATPYLSNYLHGMLYHGSIDNSRCGLLSSCREKYVIIMESVQSRILSIHKTEKEREPGAADVVSRYINDSHPRVRKEAAIALGKLKDHSGIAPLVNALYDSDRSVRDAALAGILRIGSQSAEIPVIRLLRDPDPGIRIGALCVLSRIGTEQSIGPVASMSDDIFADVREEADRTISLIRKRHRL
jgi:HEAT repeat protein